MKTKAKTTARKKGQGASSPRARSTAVPRFSARPGKRTKTPKSDPAPLRVIPAAPVAAFGMGELLIRAWAARQYAA